MTTKKLTEVVAESTVPSILEEVRVKIINEPSYENVYKLSLQSIRFIAHQTSNVMLELTPIQVKHYADLANFRQALIKIELSDCCFTLNDIQRAIKVLSMRIKHCMKQSPILNQKDFECVQTDWKPKFSDDKSDFFFNWVHKENPYITYNETTMADMIFIRHSLTDILIGKNEDDF